MEQVRDPNRYQVRVLDQETLADRDFRRSDPQPRCRKTLALMDWRAR
jgi:hypothetical protein